MNEIKIQHFLRPGHLQLERDALVRLRPTYRGIIFNAPSLADRSSGGEFLKSLEALTPFLIDPRTYALAFPRSELQRRDGRRLKDSWTKLLQEYGIAPDTLPLYPHQARTLTEQLAVKSTEFQLNCIAPQAQITWLSPPYEHKPFAVVAPYFAVMAAEDPWLAVNLELVRTAKRVAGNHPVYAVVQLYRPLLTQTKQLTSVLKAYTNLSLDGFLLWIEGLAEKKIEVEEVRAMRLLVEALSAGGARPVINMYGGYLSALLSKWGLSGFSHRQDGGESRKFTPVRGGRIDTRYYVPALHQHYTVDEVEGYLKRLGVETSGQYFERICNCIMCRTVLKQGFEGFSANFAARVLKNGRPQSIEWSERLASSHFMLERNKEAQHVESTTADPLIDELILNAKSHQDPSPLSPVKTDHLLVWARGLQQR